MGSPEQGISYRNRCGILEFEGTGVLHREDYAGLRERGESWADEFTGLKISGGITGIGEGVLEEFRNITCIILCNTVTTLAVSLDFIGFLRERDVLVRGEYNTAAEDFAKANDLRFLHCDIPIAEDENEKYHELDKITLRFHPDSAPDILHDVYSTGSSAGNYGGGSVANDLPEDFYAGCTIEKFADNFTARVRDQILNNEMLKRFLTAANDRMKE